MSCETHPDEEASVCRTCLEVAIERARSKSLLDAAMLIIKAKDDLKNVRGDHAAVILSNGLRSLVKPTES